MSLAINVLLLGLAAVSALAAFGGETWRKSEEPFVRRVTRRGWWALGCMLATLVLGVVKEVRSGASEREAQLRQETTESRLTRASTDLRELRAGLASVEPTILQGLEVATAGIRRETDYATPSLNGEPTVRVVSGRTGLPLALYGGDYVEYHRFCSQNPTPTSPLDLLRYGRVVRPDATGSLVLQVGSTDYPLEKQGRHMVIGPAGRPMPVSLLNASGLHCTLKMQIESTGRSPEAQLEPLARMIREARQAAPR